MKFYIHKLGCPKNDVDADYIAARLISDGHQAVFTPEEADSIIVNTCGFILPAREESINEIITLAEMKEKGRLKTIYATGCLAQRYGDELLAGIPELDGAFGHGVLDVLAGTINESGRLKETVKMETISLKYLDWKRRFIADKMPYAYLKISDGCNRACSFCSIPLMRGTYRSRSIDAIVEEAKFLAENGKKELILVSQEATIYGNDLKGNYDTIGLLKRLEEIDEVAWIRLMYLYPGQVDDKLVEYLAGDNKTLPYFDLPFQHINNDILKRMKRRENRRDIEYLITKIRKATNNAAIRTVFIVGFPGETEDQFKELMDFVAKNRFERLGAFSFSPEDDTLAAVMDGQVPEETKLRRLDELMTLQQEIAFDTNNSLIGSQKEVIIDLRKNRKVAIGRTYADCPEIDQEVYVSGENLASGDIVTVRIEAADGYDLKGSVAGRLR